MIDASTAQDLAGQELHTSDGSKVGKIGQIYLDDSNGQPEWVTVNTGLFGSNESFVPLAQATLADGAVVVPYTKDTIKDAPNVSEDGHLSEAEEQRLYDHYGIPYTTDGSTFASTGESGRSAGTPTSDAQASSGQVRSGQGHSTDARRTGDDAYTSTSTGHDTSGPNTDEAMTRSEERLNVGTEQMPAGKARLRKWVETEHVQVDVPVRTERAVLVSEPITDENRDSALDGPQISEEEHEVVLTAERPVVSTEAVPVERVRLDKEVDQNVETVGGDVRKERIELDDETTDAGTVDDRR